MESKNYNYNFIRQPRAEVGRATYKKNNNKYNITKTKSIVKKYLKQGSYLFRQDKTIHRRRVQ